MRNHPNDSNLPRTWLGLKEAGKEAYERGNYDQALQLFRTALRPEYECALTADRQIILSNIVACRLHLGGQAQAAAALQDAQQCVDLNPQWAKGHVRLASAYSALNRSNDACNALQTALRLDPGNRTARDMLVRELRRERMTGSTTASSETNNNNNSNPPPVDDNDNDAAPPPQNPNYVPPPPNTDNMGVEDEGWTWQDRFNFYRGLVTSWYNNQSVEVRNGIKAGLVFLAIYVAFGGRFGMDRFLQSSNSNNRPMRGNYGDGNAYDQFYRQRTASNYENIYRDSRRDTSYHDYDGYNYQGGGSSYYGYTSNSSWNSSLPSIAVMAGVVYLCHVAGLNPWHALLMLNAMGGGRRRRFGGGMYGMGGFGRRRRRAGPGAFYW